MEQRRLGNSDLDVSVLGYGPAFTLDTSKLA